MIFSRSPVAASSFFLISSVCASIVFFSAARLCSASFSRDSASFTRRSASSAFIITSSWRSSALVAVLARAVFPFLTFELELFPLGVDLRQCILGRGNFGARASPFRIRFAEAFGEGFQFGAKEGRLAVNPLQLNQMGNRRMHGNRHSITGRRSPYGETVHWQVGR